jgi:hypothetical protein
VPKRELGEYLRPSQAREIKVASVFLPQQNEGLCGPTVLKMASERYQPGISLTTYEQMTFRKELNGTLKPDMLSATRRLGLVPYRVPSVRQMLALVEQGQSVIVFQNLGVSWLPAWHFSLLVGYQTSQNLVYLHTGQTPYQELNFDRFLATWKRGGDWAYIVVPAHFIPEHASFSEALDNAIVFENLGREDLAMVVYAAMKHRWPMRFEPFLGLANLLYQDGKLRQAIDEMRLALDRNPGHPALISNLEALYEERGNLNKAKDLKALARGVQ